MPKSTRVITFGGAKKTVPARVSFKIKGRKSNVGAHGLSTIDLLDLLEAGAGKGRDKIESVLRSRGVEA